jgi:hypothetical protein
MDARTQYSLVKLKISNFILHEIELGDMSDISEEEIAKMLIEISAGYLKHPVIKKQKDREEGEE